MNLSKQDNFLHLFIIQTTSSFSPQKAESVDNDEIDRKILVAGE